MHHVERAIFDLRRGVPVLIESDEGNRLVAPVEGLDSTLLAKFFDGAAEAPRLVLTDHRLARLGHIQRDTAGRQAAGHGAGERLGFSLARRVIDDRDRAVGPRDTFHEAERPADHFQIALGRFGKSGS